MSSLKSVQDFKAKYVVDGQAVGFGSIKCRWTDDGIPTVETVKRLGIDFPEVLEVLKANNVE